VRTSQEIGEELRTVVGHLVRAVRQIDTLAAGDAAMLGLLDRDGPQTIAELAQRRGVRHQSASRPAKELLASGFVSAEPHPTDGRKQVLHLTPLGQTRLQRERHLRADRLAGAIDEALSAGERAELDRAVSLLARLAAHLG
jgi:DNA-binding MarR family transcriptional regulator